MAQLTTHHLHPPFPSDIRTAPLITISYAKLEAGDEAEHKAFFKAAKKLGFFYLDLTGSERGDRVIGNSEKLKILQEEFFRLSQDEREELRVNKAHPFFGYRSKTWEMKPKNKVAESYNVRFMILRHPSGGRGRGATRVANKQHADLLDRCAKTISSATPPRLAPNRR